MKKTVLFAAAALALSSTAVMAQSAKFTAAWDSNKVTLAQIKNITDDTSASDPSPKVAELMGTIHVANQKELMIGVSGVANIITITEAKGKNGGGTAEAIADAGISLEVRLVTAGGDAMCGNAAPAGVMVAEPGALTFASRRQALAVTVDLDVIDTNLDDGDDLAATLDIQGSVTVALGLDTEAAHHFNFVAPDLGQGVYDVVACFGGEAIAQLINNDGGSAESFVAIAQRMLTVQEVRATRLDFMEID